MWFCGELSRKNLKFVFNFEIKNIFLLTVILIINYHNIMLSNPLGFLLTNMATLLSMFEIFHYALLLNTKLILQKLP